MTRRHPRIGDRLHGAAPGAPETGRGPCRPPHPLAGPHAHAVSPTGATGCSAVVTLRPPSPVPARQGAVPSPSGPPAGIRTGPEPTGGDALMALRP